MSGPKEKEKRKKKRLRDPGPPVIRGLTPGYPNMILAKESNPEMNVSKGLNSSREGYG